MSGGSGLVGRGARVLARVSRCHRVYGERADPFAAPRNHDVGNVAVALASNVDTPPVQRPSDPHRQIALDHGALNGGHLARVRRLVTERERGQLGPDCKFETKGPTLAFETSRTELPAEITQVRSIRRGNRRTRGEG